MSRRNRPKGKRINPTYWVFCEGKTEEAYVSFLRSRYRLPIEIIPKVAGSDISAHFIRKSKERKPTHPKDKDFLIYDGDIEATISRIRKITTASIILSNPCLELWFLYHYKNQKASISSSDCIRELSNRNRTRYKKGFLDERLKMKLENCEKAIERAKTSILFDNPSSNFYIFIEELENIKSKK